MNEVEEKQKELRHEIIWFAFFNGVWCGAACLFAAAIIIGSIQDDKEQKNIQSLDEDLELK